MTLVSLPEVKVQLNMSSTDQDPSLTAYLAAVDRIIERHTGDTVTSQAFTETVVLDNWTNRIIVPKRPLTAVASIVTHDTDATPVDLTDAVVKSAGVIVLGTRLFGVYDIAYTAGMVTPPENYVQAALIIFQHLWKTRRGPTARPSTSDLPDTMGPREAGYAIPNAALELLGARSPVVA